MIARNEVITVISFMLAGIIIVALMMWGMSAGYLGTDGTHITEARIAYWSCAPVAAWILYRTGTFKGDIGTIFAIAFAPVTVLTVLFMFAFDYLADVLAKLRAKAPT